MKESFVLNGKWWTPATMHQPIEGVMTFDPSKGAILQLEGLLKESETCAMPFKIVLGVTDDGRAISLIGSNGIWLAHPYRVADDGGSDVPVCSSLCANVLLIGGHCTSPEDVDFKRFTIDLSYLSDWANSNRSVCFDRFRPDALAPAYEIGSVGKLVIESESNGSCHLSMEFNNEVSLDKGIEMVRQLRNLMALFMHRPTQEVRVRGVIGKGTKENGPNATVEIFYPSFSPDRNANPMENEDMLMPLGCIGTELGNIVAKWFSANETMAQVLDLYFAASQSHELFSETRFQMYMQAIEAYHRLRYRNFEVDPQEHAKRLEIILSSIPEQYREWMRDGLEYSNEPSHSQRLKEIYNDFRDIMDEFLEDRKLFIYQVTKTRNRLTHLEGNGDVNTLNGNDLLLATLRLRLLLEMCLLKEIGIDHEQMKKAVLRNTMFTKIRIGTKGSL